METRLSAHKGEEASPSEYFVLYGLSWQQQQHCHNQFSRTGAMRYFIVRSTIN